MEQLIVRDDSGEKLDSFILRNNKKLSVGKINKYLRENKIKVNGKKQPLSYRVCKGDVVNMYLPYETNKLEVKNIDIVYEDENILILCKPAGLLTDNDGERDSLINRAENYLGYKPFLCHRLDTGTSGLVIIAKTQAVLDEINEMIKSRRITKEYICITFGHPHPEKNIMKAWLTKNQQKGTVFINEKETKNAKEIKTEYTTLAVSGPLALLKVNLLTGRTHQIRAHMAYIGCPILGDSKYGNNEANRKYKLKYQALCAYRLTFPDIVNGELSNLSRKSFCAQKPWYYEQLLNGELK